MSSPDDNSHGAEQVVSVLDQEIKAITTGDSRLYFGLLSDDAVFLPPNSPLKEGPEVRRWLKEFLDGIAVEWLEHSRVETVVRVDMAYHVFTCVWRVTPRAGGDSTLLRFKGLHILRRGSEGNWKIAREIWNTSPS